MKKVVTPSRRRALVPDPDVLAAQVLTFLAADPTRLGRFLSLTGLDAKSLRAASRGPAFSRAVLAYALSDDGLLVAFSSSQGLEAESVASAMRAVTERDVQD